MRRALTLAGFLLLLLGSGSAAAAGPPGLPAVEPAPADGLNVVSASESIFSGGFVRGSGVITFAAEMVSPVVTTAEITVNDKSFTARKDIKSGQAHWSGNGATLTPEDRAAMLDFDKALLTTVTEPLRNNVAESVPAHQDLLSRLSALVAEAPLGVKFVAQDVPKPDSAIAGTNYTPDGAKRVESCLQDVIRTTESHSDAREIGVAACQEANEDGILYFGSCSVTYRWMCYDSDSTCFGCYSVLSGYGSSVGCLGRCGPGCGMEPPTGGHGPYTYDCGDHDQCGRVHGGSTNPWDSECGDEYWEADDDFMWGSQNC